MKLEDFHRIVEHVRMANYPKRAIYAAAIQPRLIAEAVSDLDVHSVELIDDPPIQESPEDYLERRLGEICTQFSESKKEPSTLIIKDAVLLARYSISLAPLFSRVISPRSIAVLCLPTMSEAQALMSLSDLVDVNISEPLQRIEKQIGGQESAIIEE